jgi:hypothetical protein
MDTCPPQYKEEYTLSYGARHTPLRWPKTFITIPHHRSIKIPHGTQNTIEKNTAKNLSNLQSTLIPDTSKF